MKKILVNYNFTPEKEWIGDDYLIYDRSEERKYLNDFDQSKIIYTPNKGNVDYDKLSYLVDNYETLPEVFLWGKTNLFKFITKEEYEKVKDNQAFTPLLTQGHATYSDSKGGVVCYYQDGMYHERNDSWYVNELDVKHFRSFYDFSRAYNLPSPAYLPFAPGGNYILTREKVYKYSRDYYDDMRQALPYSSNPAEAHMCERAYFLLWRA
jgi:hypothetical protein